METLIYGVMGMIAEPGRIVMMLIGGVLMYLGIKKEYEPTLLVPMGLGTILAFMMSVTVLSIPSLTMLSRVVKPKLLATFVGICLIGMIISGYVFNWLQPLFV